jgi:subtilase family serine protease
VRKNITPLPRLSVLVCTAVFLLFTIAAQTQSQPLMTRHVRELVANGQAPLVGPLRATQSLRFDIVLPLRDRAGLQNFVQEVNDPTSPVYHQFLMPQEVTARFGPSQENWNALVAFAKASGFEIIGGTLDSRDLWLTGTVANIERAFHVNMNIYRDPTEGRTFFAVDREPTVDLPFQLWHITGLDNDSQPHPLYVKKSDYAKAHGIDPGKFIAHATTGSGPSDSFLGSDMRAAYYEGTALTGSGQNIALFEFAGTDLVDLTTYYKNVGQTEPYTPTLISTGGYGTSCVDSGGSACDDTEQTLDMTQAMGMAPGSTMLYMYVCGDVLANGSGNISDTACISAMVATTDAPLSKQISCSWGWTPADPGTLDPYFEQMASQGQNFFAASGDSSAWSASNEAWPADDANIVSVGGTDLTTTKAAGPWASETAWADSGGGISPDSIPIPSWQQLSGVITSANKGSTTLRNGPDVSANANFSFYVCADQTTCTANEYGGTSFATPMWAGYLALANQQAAANGDTIGFIDPILYPAALTSSYSTYFHDVSSGSCGKYSAIAGYDLCTGWGSPNTTGIINLLAGSTTQSFTLSASPNSLTITQGNNGTSTITVTDLGGFSGSVTLAASGLPSGVTAGFNPNPTTTTSTLTLTASSTATIGSATVTITGTSGSLMATTTIALTVNAGSAPNFTIGASPAQLTITQGNNGTSTITIGSQNSFNSATTLTVSGLPSGVTSMFSTNPVTPPANSTATSTLTLTASATATTGNATITVTGTSGTLTHNTTIALTVTAAGGGAQIATYNTTYTAPACLTAGSSCASGSSVATSLLNSARNLTGPTESNAPNTLKASSCADGTVSGTYHGPFESDDLIVVSSAGGNLTHGTSVTIKTSWWAYSTTTDYFDLFYTASVTNPSWVLISSNNLASSTTSENTTTATFTPPTAGTYAVRAQLRYHTGRKVTSPSACQANSGYDDHDDLVFVVQ